MHARAHARAHTQTHTHSHTHIHTHTRTHKRTQACTHARTHAHTHARTHAHTHTHTCISAHKAHTSCQFTAQKALPTFQHRLHASPYLSSSSCVRSTISLHGKGKRRPLEVGDALFARTACMLFMHLACKCTLFTCPPFARFVHSNAHQLVQQQGQPKINLKYAGAARGELL